MSLKAEVETYINIEEFAHLCLKESEGDVSKAFNKWKAYINVDDIVQNEEEFTLAHFECLIEGDYTNTVK